MIVPDRGGLRFGEPVQKAGLASSPVDFRSQPGSMQLYNSALSPSPAFTSTMNNMQAQPTVERPELQQLQPAVNPPTLDPYSTMPDLQNFHQQHPAVVGSMAEEYAQRSQGYGGLGGMNQGLGNLLGQVQSQQNTGLSMSPQISQMSGKSIPDIAARTVGETVRNALQSRIPTLSQGIGSLIGNSLL